MTATATVDLTARDAAGLASTFRRSLSGRTARIVTPGGTDVTGTVTAVEGMYLIVTQADGRWARSGSTVELVAA